MQEGDIRAGGLRGSVLVALLQQCHDLLVAGMVADFRVPGSSDALQKPRTYITLASPKGSYLLLCRASQSNTAHFRPCVAHLRNETRTTEGHA